MSELPVVSVHIPLALRNAVGGYAEIMASGETVGEVLEAVGHQYPHWISYLMGPDGNLASNVSIYVGGVSIRELSGLETSVQHEESINIVLSGDSEIHPADQDSAIKATILPEPVISIGDE